MTLAGNVHTVTVLPASALPGCGGRGGAGGRDREAVLSAFPLAVLCAGLLLITYVPTLTVGIVHAMRGGASFAAAAATCWW